MLRKITGAALTTAAAVGLTLFSPATPAHVDGIPCTLEIRDWPNAGVHTGRYLVYAYGAFPMTDYDAQGFINNGGRMELRLWGADWPDPDDFLKGPYFAADTGAGPGQMFADPNGLNFSSQLVTTGIQLNEDGSTGDEIYVHAKFIDGDGGVRQCTTNEVHRQFW